MNRHIWQIFRYEVLRSLRRRGYLFATLGIPLLGLALVLGIQLISSLRSANEPDAATALMDELDLRGIRKAGYVDETGLFADAGELTLYLTRYEDEATARAALDAGEVDVYYVIPADYLQTGNVTLVMPEFSVGKINDTLITRLILGALSDVDPALLERLTAPSVIEEVNLQRELPEGVRHDEEASFAVVYVFSIGLFASLFMTNGYLMRSVIEEKETRLIEILVSSVRPLSLLVGKILALGVVGLLQIGVWLASLLLLVRLAGSLDALAQTVSGFFIPVDMIPLLLVYFVLAYLLFAAFYGAVGALSNSTREGPQYALVLTLPAMLPYYFTTVFAAEPDGAMATLMSLIPPTSPLAMMQRLVISTVPAWQIAVSLLLLVLAILGMMWLAGRLFRVQVLLAGHMPKLRDIPRLVRG